MRILLVNGPLLYVHTLWRLFPNTPPLNLQILSAVLRQAGHETYVLNHQATPPRRSRLVHEIRAFRPDVVGFSCVAMVDAEAVRAMIREVRTLFPDLFLIAGGQVPTFLPDFYLGDDGVHVVVRHEAETTLPRLLTHVAAATDWRHEQGLAFLDGDGGVVTTPEPDEPPDLDKLPFADREGRLAPSFYTPGTMATVETYRGCPHNCTFCSIPAFFRRPLRRKSAARVVEELQHLSDQGVTEVFFVDDSFAVAPDHALGIAEGILARGLQVKFGVQIRADVVARHPELMRRLKRAGLFWAVVGFEGYDEATLSGVGKNAGVATNESASRLLHELGVLVFGTHLYGAPGMTWRSALATWRLGRRHSDIFRMTIYTPLLGSRSYERLRREGRILATSLRDFNYGNWVIDDEHPPALLQAGFFAALLAHYAAPDTLASALADPDPIRRRLQRHAYHGAFRYVVGALANRLLDR